MKRNQRKAFTLVELLTVIGVIAILIAMLLPSLARARAQAQSVQCKSNLRQVGIHLQIYSNEWEGWLYPPGLGTNRPREKRWPVHVFKPAVWNPPILLCPSDASPAEEHSYILNDFIVLRQVKAGSRDLGEGGPSEVIVMGEKVSRRRDYYMNSKLEDPLEGDYWTRVEPYRHGIRLGSNYLFMDWHVATQLPKETDRGINPWDVKVDEETEEP